MANRTKGPLVQTIKERCRVCYTCVRECPAKAIRISGGQAEVIAERCIGCGLCVRVCSQNAKQVRDCSGTVNDLLAGEEKVAAVIAPSFAAEFHEIDYRKLVGMLREMGFGPVVEVAFGADLVVQEIRKLLDENSNRHYIESACPAVVSYIEKYHPRLVKNLTPIVSPMIAISRAVKQIHGKSTKVVFIGPCIAKKYEAERHEKDGDVEAVLTFAELRGMLELRGIKPDAVPESEFDPPYPGRGMLYPLGRGMLQAAGFNEDLITNDFLAADGTDDFVEAIKEFDEGFINAKLLGLLCCHGCTMGTGMTTKTSRFTRRVHVGNYVQEQLKKLDIHRWEEDRQTCEYLDLSMNYQVDDHRLPAPSSDQLKLILGKMGKEKPEDELNCGACGYDTCVEHAIAIHKGLAESEMCLPYTIDKLKATASELSESYEQLVNTKSALIQAEKLASMGQLAAGIAHEVNNPLGVVLLYSHLLLDQCDPESDMYKDLEMVVEQTGRAKKIVSELLNFARKNKVVLRTTKLNQLVDRSLHGIIAPGNVKLDVAHRNEDVIADIDPDQIIQVLVNLVTNAIEAMPQGGRLTIATGEEGPNAIISVSDTGTGIDDSNIKKLFEPFFTTKQMGKGTGLGLAVTYGIIKMHHGTISVDTNTDPAKGPTGTTFTVTLPKTKPGEQDNIMQA